MLKKIVSSCILLFISTFAYADTYNVPTIDSDGNYEIIITITKRISTQGTFFELYEQQGSAWVKIGDGSDDGLAKPFAFTNKSEGIHKYDIKLCNVSASRTGSSVTCGSNFREVLVEFTPAKPVVTVPAASATGEYSVSWSGVSGISSYELYENDQLIATTKNISVSFAGSSARLDGTYEYKVKACKTQICSAYSNAGLIKINTSAATSGVVGIDPMSDPIYEDHYYGALSGSESVGDDGSFSYFVPIRLPTGINGVQPNLGLQYHSNRKNSIMGWGWSLSGLSSIHRCSAQLYRDGYTSGIQATDSFQYCLDGSRLIEVAANEYRTEIETFSRIHKYSSYWTVTHQDGSISRYGYNSDSRLEDDSNSAYTWFIDEFKDVFENAYQVVYAKNATAGSHYPARIDYTFNALLAAQYSVVFTYEQRGDSLNRYVAGKLQGIDKRLKSVDVVHGGLVTQSYGLVYQESGQTYHGKLFDDPAAKSRLAEITLCYDGGSKCAEPLQFEWSLQSRDNYMLVPSHEEYEQIPLMVGNNKLLLDINGDGKKDVYAVDDSAERVASGSLSHANLSQVKYDTRTPRYFRADVNGDKFDDVVKVANDQSLMVFLSNGTSINTSSADAFSIPRSQLVFNSRYRFQYISTVNDAVETKPLAEIPYNLAFVDANGDGYVDVVRYPQCGTDTVSCTLLDSPGDISVALNNQGRGFLDFTAWYTNWTGGNTFHRLTFVDLNGDGAIDFYATNNVYLEKKHFVVLGINTGKNQFTVNPKVYTDFLVGAHAGDFNGDGIKDFVKFPISNVSGQPTSGFDGQLQLSMGFGKMVPLGNDLPGYLPAQLPAFDGNSDSPCYQKAYCTIRIVDFNQDGLDDIVEERNVANRTCRDAGGGLKDDNGLLSCNNWFSELLDQTEFVYLSMGSDASGNVRFSAPEQIRDFALAQAIGLTGWISFANLESEWPVRGGLDSDTIQDYVDRYPRSPTLGFDDYNADGTVEDDPRLTSRLVPNRIEAVVEASRVIKIDYQSLGSAESIYDVSTGAELVEPASRLRLRFATKLLSVSNPNGGDNTTRYQYSNLIKNPFDLGELGFSKITKTTKVVGEIPIRTESYFYQNISKDYLLANLLSRRVTVAQTDSGDKILADSRYQWKVRKFLDDMDPGFESPHYFVYLYRQSTETRDLGGLTSFTKTQNTTDTQPRCSALPVKSSIVTTDTDQDYHSSGVLLYSETATCDFTGEEDSVQIHAQENSNITSAGDAIGLVQTMREYAWTGREVTSADRSAFDVKTQQIIYNDLGLPSARIREPEATGTSLYFKTDLKYNVFGSVSQVLNSWDDVANDGLSESRSETTIDESYSASGRQVTITDAKGLTRSTRFHPLWGTAVAETDANGLTTTTQFDALGRIKIISYPNATETLFDYRSCVGCDGVTGAAWYLQSKSSGSSATRVYRDAQNREIATRTKALNGDFVYTRQSFNNLGLVAESGSPHYLGEAANTLRYDYDALGRVEAIHYPDDTQESFTYHGLVRTSTNRINQTQTKHHNGSGWVRRSVDEAGIPVEFTYWQWGQLKSTQVNDDPKTRVEMDYDKLGRKTRLSDPNLGTHKYTYNALDLVATETDAKQQRTCKMYDILGRLVGRIDLANGDCSGSASQHWRYDSTPMGRGKPASLTGKNTDGSAYSEEYSYNAYGLPETVSRSFDGKTFKATQHYDTLSRPAGMTYPSGYKTALVYGSFGHQAEITDSNGVRLWRADAALADGRLQQFTLGNGVVTERTYHPTLDFIESVHAAKGSIVVQDHLYQFDSVGNLKQRKDKYHNVTQSFCYDNLNRLRFAGGATCNDGSKTYDYDALGNLRSKAEDGVQTTLGYAGMGQAVNSAGPHAVTSANGWSYLYDASGNLATASKASGSSRQVQYSPFNTPTRITEGAKFSSFVYAPNEKRIKHVDSNGRTTLYVGSAYEEVTHNGVTQKIHTVGDAVRFIQEFGLVPTTRYEYLHRDHLGSIVAVTPGTVSGEGDVDRTSFGVWGERRFLQWDGPKETGYVPSGSARGYTDHEQLDAVGLIHMNGRVYDPELGRFLSADPLVQAPYNSQSYNRYSYVFNNPLSFTDPTGYKTEDTSKCEKKDELDVCPKGAQPTEKDKDDGTTAEDRRLMMQHQMTLWGYNADTNPRNADIWNAGSTVGVLTHYADVWNPDPTVGVLTLYAKMGVQGHFNHAAESVRLAAILQSGSRLLAARVGGGASAGIGAIAEDLGLKTQGHESIQSGLSALGVSVTTDSAKGVDNLYKVGAGGGGITGGGILMGAGGASGVAVGVGVVTVFLSAYALGRGIDNYTGNTVTGLVTDLMCGASGSC